MALKKHLENLIEQLGPITVAQFMAEVLCHPEHGYYQKKDPFGKQGDFTTSPEISQMFGEMIGIWCASIWQQMSSPKKILLVEMGGGRGTLMKDLLRGTKHIPGFHQALSIIMVENSESLTQKQKQTLADSHNNISWQKDLSNLPELPIVFVANELFDALPIHQYIKHKGKWHERKIAKNNDQLCFALSPDAIADSFLKNTKAKDGGIYEHSPASISLIERIADHITNYTGSALVIDYGYGEQKYQDSLQAVKQHKYHDIFKDLGEADITAHVDFGALAKAAQNKGAKILPLMNQGDFLKSLGIEIRAKQLLKSASVSQNHDIKTALNRLISKDQMGNLFKVQIIYR